MQFLDTSRIRVRVDQRFAANDGTQLSVDLYLPADVGRYPALLIRTAMDNNHASRSPGATQTMPAASDRWKGFAAQGFIVATADVRGRGDSDGAFRPFVHEASDGVATVAWLRSLSESNGRIGAFGSGYAAFCAWAAVAADARIDAIASISPFGAIGEGLCHRGGAVRLDSLFWMHLTGGRTLQPAAVPPWPQVHRCLPIITMDAALGRNDVAWGEWLEHLDTRDAFWAPLTLADRLSSRAIPGLHITGWWDAHLGGARYYYDAAKRSGTPQTLIIGPWDTAAVRRPTSIVGGTDFGPRSLIDVDEILMDFFCAQLRDEPNTFANPSTRLFITGRNEWIESDVWPMRRGSARELHLASGGAANTRRGDGALSDTAPSAATADTLTSNPQRPVDFQPNFTSFAAVAFSLTLDQRHITARDEALVYTSTPFIETLTVMGRPIVTLTVSTDVPDADLFVLLSDSFPLGLRDLHLSHAAIRLATLEGFSPGEPVTFTLELDDLAHDFLPAHSARLTVVPSLFPLYARNPHRTNYLGAAEPTVAVIELHHGPGSPGILDLPAGDCCHLKSSGQNVARILWNARGSR